MSHIGTAWDPKSAALLRRLYLLRYVRKEKHILPKFEEYCCMVLKFKYEATGKHTLKVVQVLISVLFKKNKLLKRVLTMVIQHLV